MNCWKTNRLFYPGLFIACWLISFEGWSQPPVQNPDYNKYSSDQVLDSLRELYTGRVIPQGSGPERATLLALSHYPELQGNRIKIKYKQRVRHPITASYAFGNAFRGRKRHVYVLLIKEGAFIDHISLNRQVAVIGHEMAHFSYYRERPAIGMIPWGLKYLFSKKFRRNFERDADFMAIDHGLGWQLMETSMYTSFSEVVQYMEETGLYGAQ